MPKVNKPKSTDIQEQLAKKLQTLRQQKDVSQSEIAKYIGLTVGAYQNYENGRREANYETLCKLADFYNVSTDYLLGRTPVKQMTTKEPDVLSQLAQIFNLTEMQKVIVQTYIAVSPKERKKLIEVMEEVVRQKEAAQQAPETPIKQIKSQIPPQPVQPPIVQQSNSQNQPSPVEQSSKIESTQTKWRFTARRTDGRYESRYATSEEVEKLKALENDPEPEF